VRNAYVVGVAHPVRGENIAAFIVPRSGHLSREDLVAHCRSELASYKIPEHFFFCEADEIPVSASNKVEKGRLRERAERELIGAG
jgi:acyl-CoA synthetase (AMP-forming)/AMP-acid ligase II